MKRRQVLGGVAGLLGVPGVVRAQASAPRPAGTIGYLHPRTIAYDHPTLRVLRSAWQPLGYVEGETVLLRSADGDMRRLPGLVDELIASRVGVLIAVGSEAVRVASRITKTLPIVAIDLETDPVRAGYAASFARPGGNVTGLFLDQPSLAGKWIELLREASPAIRRLGLIWDPTTGRDQMEVARSVAQRMGLDAVELELGPGADYDHALRALAGRPPTGVVQLTSPGFIVVAPKFAAAAQKYRLPTISFLKVYTVAGGLMSYGPIQEIYFRRSVVLADAILRGAKPGDVSIEGPDRFEFVINLKTARAIGIAVPQSLLLRADEVIG